MTAAAPTQNKQVYKHALREINFMYEEGKTVLTKQDEALMQGYIKLHDFELMIDKTADAMFKHAGAINKKLKPLKAQLESVTDTFNSSRKVAEDLGNASYNITTSSLDILIKNQDKTNSVIQDYHKELTIIYDEIELLSKEEINYLNLEEEESNEVYDEFDDISLRHYNDYLINTIDIVAFEAEHEDFLGFRSMKADRRDSLHDFCQTVITDYNEILIESTGLFNLWDEFLKRCELLIKVAELHSIILAGSAN